MSRARHAEEEERRRPAAVKVRVCVQLSALRSPRLPNIIRVLQKLQDLLENVVVYLPNSIPVQPLAEAKPFSYRKRWGTSRRHQIQPGRGRPQQSRHRPRSVAGTPHRYQRSWNPTGTYGWKNRGEAPRDTEPLAEEHLLAEQAETEAAGEEQRHRGHRSQLAATSERTSMKRSCD